MRAIIGLASIGAFLSACAGAGTSGGSSVAQSQAILLYEFPAGASTPISAPPGEPGSSALSWTITARPSGNQPGGRYLVEELGYSGALSLSISPACFPSSAYFAKIVAGSQGATIINLGTSVPGPDAALSIISNAGSGFASFPSLVCVYTISDASGHSATITIHDGQLLAYELAPGASAPAAGSFGSSNIFDEHFFGLSLYVAEAGAAGPFTLSAAQSSCPITTPAIRPGSATANPTFDFPNQSYTQGGACNFTISDGGGQTISIFTGSP